MKNIIDAPFVQEYIRLLTNMYRLGWHERNSGNASYLIDEKELSAYLDLDYVQKSYKLLEPQTELALKYYLVSGTGKYFKNVETDPIDTIGIIRITADGTGYDILWGFGETGRPTSELSTHLAVHAEKLKQNPKQRVVLHAHATNLLAMNYVHPLDDAQFSRTLWKMATECIVVFPEGVGIVPWMVCGSTEIGHATVDKMKEVNAVIWAMHGVVAVGETLDDAFGLIETMEKAATIYMKAQSIGIKQSITDEQLHSLAKAFHVIPKVGYLK